jgi:hypothetical protein
MGMSADDILNNLQGGFAYPGINPPASGLPGSTNSSVYTGGLSLMGPGGLPWGQQSIQTLMANTPPPMLYGQNPYTALTQGKINTGSALDPPTPTPPVNNQNQQTDTTTGQAPSDSASGQDFLSTVRDTIGGVARGALDVLGTGQYLVARPLYEQLAHPQSFQDAMTETADKIMRGEANLKTPFDVLSRKFEEEQDPGIAKFVGEVAFDPTTYLGLGEIGAVAKLAGKVPLAGHLLEPAVKVAGLPFTLPEQALNKAGPVIGNTAVGILNNSLSLYESKNAASKILGAFLPGDTVKSVIDAIPNTYTGIPINWVADPINSRYPKLGLPTVLKVPEVRDIQVAKSAMLTKDAALSAFAERGINLAAARTQDVSKALWGIYSARPDNLSPASRVIQDVLKRPTAVGQREWNNLGSTLGVKTEADAEKLLTLNQTIGLYRKGPSVADPVSGIDEKDAIDAVGSIFGVDFKSNPDAGRLISRYLQGKTDDAHLLVHQLASKAPADILAEFGTRASNVTRSEWELGIQVQRAHNTLWDQGLNNFDNIYTNVWKDTIQRYLAAPLSRQYLHFMAFMPWNVGETYVRSALYGGGLTIRRMDQHSFALENALIPDTPPRLLQLTPTEKKMVGMSATAETMATGAGPLTKLNPMDGFFEGVNDKGNDLEVLIQRNFWKNQFDHAFDNIQFEKGLSARSGFSAYYAAGQTPDVSKIPELAGLDQKLVDDVARQSARTVGSTDAFNSLRANIDSGVINREKLAGIIDGQDFVDLHPSSKNIWYNATRGATDSSHIDQAITAVIDNEKRMAQGAPDAIAEKFSGLNQYISDAGKKLGFNADDMTNAYNAVHAMYSQFAGVPELIRQMEYDEINRVLNQKGNSWRQTIHDEWNARFQESLNKVGKELDTANTNIQAIGNKFGVGPEMQTMTNLLTAEHQLTISKWAEDLAFQKEFFAQAPRGWMKSAPNYEEYYAKRGAIWADYYGQRQLIRTQQMDADTAIRAKIAQSAQAQAVDDAQIKVATLKLNRAKSNHTRYNSAKTAESLANAQAELDRLTSTKATQQAITPPISTESAIGAEAQVSIEPGVDASVAKLQSFIDNGADPDHAASFDYDSLANDARSGGTQSPPNVSGSTSGAEIPATRPTEPTTAGSNGTSAQPVDADPGTISSLYAAADSLRPRLNQAAVDVINNPAMTKEHTKYLTSWMDNFKKEFESLNVDNQRVLTDSVREAGQRARGIFDNTFVDYDGRNKFDWLMQHMFPFWMYESRRWPFLAQTVLKRPALGSTYAAYMDQTNQGYIPLGEVPFDINPLRGTVVGAISRLSEQDRPLKYTQGLQGALDSIDATLGKFGLYMGPAFSILSNIVRGAGGASAPPTLNMILNIAHASPIPIVSGIAGGIEQNVLPSPFRDYYTRMIIASQGQEPDKIYSSALDGDETANNILDAAGKQADLVNIVLQQTGVLRFRTEEYQHYQDARQQSIYEMTGITPQQQQDMQANGQTLNQVAVLSPEQQSKLNAVPGTKEFNQISQPLLNPAAQKLRLAQRDFYDTLDKERLAVTAEQTQDDRRLQNGIISGTEWRKRYQERATKMTDLFDDLRKAPPYDKIPISQEDQAKARSRFNLPPYVDSPQAIALNEYYAVKPQVDAVTGDADWTKFFDDRQKVLAKYPFLQQELDRRTSEKDTVQVQQFKKDMDVLRPYFGIKDAIIARMPQLGQAASDAQMAMNLDPIQGRIYAQNNPQVKMLNQLVSQAQKWARLHDPAMDAALVRWYGASPIVYQELQSHKPHTGLPTGGIPMR